jgi:hypothetical protein
MYNDLNISVSLGAVPLHLHASALALPSYYSQPFGFSHSSLHTVKGDTFKKSGNVL